MYGMGFGPTSGRGAVLLIDDSYDLNGRGVLNPVERAGGIPERRETGGQLFGGAAPPVVQITTPAPLQATPAVIVSSAAPALDSAPDVQVSDYFGLLPWWGWAGLGVGAWFMFGKGGRR